MAKPVAHSPLAGVPPVKTDRYTQREIFPLGKIIIRGRADDEQFSAAVKAALSLPTFPIAVNATAAGGTRVGGNKGDTLLALSPTEWLLWTDDKNRAARQQALEEALADIHAAVVDVSDYYTIIEIAGESARTVLAEGTPLDLAQLTPGTCAQTHHQQTNILIAQTAANTYHLQTRLSHAHHLTQTLETTHHQQG